MRKLKLQFDEKIIPSSRIKSIGREVMGHVYEKWRIYFEP